MLVNVKMGVSGCCHVNVIDAPLRNSDFWLGGARANMHTHTCTKHTLHV